MLPSTPSSEPDATRRFRDGAQLLGRLQHPGLARIYGAGTVQTPRGPRPFFAKELVRGRPLVEHARESRLAPAERARLLLGICEAVEHAHGRGVSRLGLRAGGVLVDRSGRVKIVDFDLARLARGGPADPGEDVRAAGRIAEELLALEGAADPDGDHRAIARKAIAAAGCYASVGELAADLRRSLAGRPVRAADGRLGYRARKAWRRHRRLLAAGAALGLALLAVGAVLFAHRERARRAEGAVAALAREGALERERANLAADYLGELVSGLDGLGPDAGLGELLERVRAELGADFAGAPGLEAPLRLALSWVDHARGDFDSSRVELERALELANGGPGADPRLELEARSGLRLLSAERGELEASEELAREVLELARRSLPDGDALVLNALRNLALAVERRGRSGEARALLGEYLERAEREGPAAGAQAARVRAMHHSLADAGDPDRTAELARQAYERCRDELGPAHQQTLDAANEYGALLLMQGRGEAIAVLESAHGLAISVYGASHPRSLELLHNLAAACLHQGDAERATALQEQCHSSLVEELGTQHPTTLVAQHNLARALQTAGRWDGALAAYEDLMATCERALPPVSGERGGYRANFAEFMRVRGELGRAEALYREAAGELLAAIGLVDLELADWAARPARGRRSWIGEGAPTAHHESLLRCTQGLGVTLLARGETDRALALLECAAIGYGHVRGEAHLDALNAALNVGVALLQSGRSAEAGERLEALLERTRSSLGPDHPRSLETLNTLAAALARAGEVARAEALFRELVERALRQAPEQVPAAPRYLANLGLCLAKRSSLDEAMRWCREALELHDRSRAPGDPARFALVADLAQVSIAAGEGQAAAAELTPAVAAAEEQLGAGHALAGRLRQLLASANGGTP